MKESVTKFDLEAAFKALDEIEIPSVGGVKANRAPLTEVFSKKLKTEQLIEEYYDVGNNDDLDEAQKAREAEIAAAKLARIEKIVDLDAKTPEDLLTSYVGKFIMQCPQCMTLFYKDKEDIEESEDDPSVVNVSEVCQHCGNESGYTLVGKVGAAEEATAEEETPENLPVEDETEAETSEEVPDLTVADESDAVETEEDTEDLDLDLDIEVEDDEDQAEESLQTASGQALTESAWPTVEDHRLEAFKEATLDTLITYECLEEAQLFTKLAVKVVDPAYADGFRNVLADVDNINRPTTLYVSPKLLDIPYDQAAAEVRSVLAAVVVHRPIPAGSDAKTAMEFASQDRAEWKTRMNESLTEAAKLDFDVSDSEFKELMASFGAPMTDKKARAMLDSMSESLQEDVEAEDTSWLAAEGFEHLILSTFEDEGHTGYEVLYSKDDVDIVTVEVWSANEPVSVLENAYAEHLFQPTYETFDAFAADLDYKVGAYLQEGIFDKLKKGVEKAKSIGTKILDKLKTREEKADWIFTHASLDPNQMEETDDGDYVPKETHKRFKHFAVMGFKNKLAGGKLITTVPSFNNKELVPGLKRCETREKYDEIDKLAKGWSSKPGNGPAFIYLSEDEESKKLVFVCQYFNGELDKSSDQLERYFKMARKEFEGSKAIAKAGGFKQQGDDEPAETPIEETDTTPDAPSDTEET